MQPLIRTSVPVLVAVLLFALPSFAQVDIWTVGVDNTRQGWNKSETVLTPKNVPKLRKIDRKSTRLNSSHG